MHNCSSPKRFPAKIVHEAVIEKMTSLQTQFEEVKLILEQKKRELQVPMQSPADLESWMEFLKVFGEIFKKSLDPGLQTKIIKKLVHKIELGPKDLKIHYFVGEDHIKQELTGLVSSDFFCHYFSSNSLTNGGRNKD